jgi:arsenite methyltransferase
MATDPLRDPQSDVWEEWLRHLRHADDPQYGEFVRAIVEGYADRVLDGARLAPGMTMVDIGTGEGLVAFRAIDRVGPSLRVVLTDISAPLLRHADREAERRGVQGQCTFIECPADRLDGIADASADALTIRSALAYVADKRAALREFFRVLRPGGRISLAEPVLMDDAFAAQALRMQVESLGPEPADRFLPLLQRWRSAQYPDSEEARTRNPLMNYSERDLLNFVNGSGFADIHLELHIDVTPSPVTSWDTFIGVAPYPGAPTLRAILADRFSAEEQRLLEMAMRPAVEAGTTISTERMVYVSASKPGV